jgi:hypothetical protein
MSSVKEAARSIVDNLPEQATSDDLMYELYVKQKIDAPASRLPQTAAACRTRRLKPGYLHANLIEDCRLDRAR